MWGKISYDTQRKVWIVRGIWQGKRQYFSQCPTRNGLIPCETKRLAQRLQEAISLDIESRTFSPAKYKAAKPLNLSNYIEKWLKLKKPELATATHYDYSNSLLKHVQPVLGDKYLPDINYDDLRELMNKIDRKPKGKKNVMDALRQLLKDAQRSGHIDQVPEIPKFKGVNKITHPIIKYISQADQMRIVAAIPLQHRPIFLFMMATGCRPSEARALRKSDVKEDVILFEVAFGRGEELKSVKQAQSADFPMTEELEQIFDEMPKHLTQWMFPNPTTGKPYSKNINKIWNKACDKAEVKRINLYNATRHSFACQLLNNGTEKSIVSRLLRHSDPRMIERYGKYEMDPLRAAVEKVRRLNFCQDETKKDQK